MNHFLDNCFKNSCFLVCFCFCFCFSRNVSNTITIYSYNTNITFIKITRRINVRNHCSIMRSSHCYILSISRNRYSMNPKIFSLITFIYIITYFNPYWRNVRIISTYILIFEWFVKIIKLVYAWIPKDFKLKMVTMKSGFSPFSFFTVLIFNL